MRKETQKDKYSFKKWETLFKTRKYCSLFHVLQVGDKVHFFFIGGSKKKTFVMTIPLYYPYRIHDEDCVRETIWKKSTFDGKKRKKMPYGCWKLKGKNFFNVIKNGRPLSSGVEEKDPKISQYLIVTSDQWLEFTSCRPIWCSHNTMDFPKLFEQYTAKRSKSFWYFVHQEKLKKKRKMRKKKT